MRQRDKEEIIQRVTDEVLRRLTGCPEARQADRQRAEALLRAYPGNKISDIPARRQDAAIVDAFLREYGADPYIDAIRLFYFDGLTNAQAAGRLYCDDTTCRRNRSRLVRAFAEKLEKGK